MAFYNGNEDAYFLILEGKPIGEPVAQHGPFVMNTEEEIREAINDYGKTQFGGWPWGEKEVVHSKEKGRFALHSNGKRRLDRYKFTPLPSIQYIPQTPDP